jgi:hypothetical protein
LETVLGLFVHFYLGDTHSLNQKVYKIE